MGIAKEKMFGKQKKSFPLQRFIEKGSLLAIDVAYARLQVLNKDEKELALHAALLASSRSGHLCLEKSVIEDPELAALIPDGNFYLPKYKEVEDRIVQEVCRLLSFPKKLNQKLQIPHVTEEQKQAMENALACPISLITGGPGTGKTYTAAQIAKAMQCATIVTAPTGKAAAHLEGQMDIPVKGGTLHALLLEETLDAKLVIVDECSMIDPFLFARLLSSIQPETTLVLMGDKHQLPAVDGGSVFADFIASKRIPTAFFSQCMRSDRKEILDLATSILEGKAKDIGTIDLGFKEGSVEKIYQNIWKHVKDKDFSHFRILSTLRKGPLGVDALNRFLFMQFSSKADQFPIMITRNDRRTGLSNGETGFIHKNKAFFKDQSFYVQELPSYEYAYCISVHKSQGSEYGEVLFLVPEGSESFTREILYTAVTRAKFQLEIDGNPQQIALALGKSSKKLSNICPKLNGIS